jgi:3',5'-cyclic AMP phosphodiesterase CpdA
MKSKGLLYLLGVCALTLSSCSGVKHEIKEYVLDLDIAETGDYRILQLTDTHLGDKDNLEKHFKFMDLTIKDSHPDFIVVTGDLFTFTSRTTAKRFFEYLDSKDVPWTVTYGNHDEQCYFSVDWLTRQLNSKYKHCVFKDIQDDDIQGNANFAINLKRGGHIFEQLIVMDSNRYYFGKYFGYDYFKQNQIDWYKNLIDYTTEQNGGSIVPSLMFYHIPLPEIEETWDYETNTFKEGTIVKFENTGKGEKTCNPNPEYAPEFFDVIKEKGSTTGMYFGHDHYNDFIVNYQGIDFAYGIKSTDRIYFQEDMLGGRTIVLHSDNTVEYEHHFHTYEEVK